MGKKYNKLYIIIGVIAGVLMAYFDVKINLISLVINIIFLFLSIFLHIIIHESGHLVFGLLSGYEFSTFRIANIMVAKINEKYTIKKFYLAGTGGQCTMNPPDYEEAPYILFNMGGSLFNFFFSFISLFMFFLVDNQILKTSILIFFFTGIYLGFVNIIPLKLSLINNDGYNIYDIKKNKNALKVFKNDLKIDVKSLEGIRVKDMPENLFYLPTDDDENSYLINLGAYHNISRFMDMHEFSKASELINKYINKDYKLIKVIRNFIILDLIFCELVSDNYDKNRIDNLLNKDVLSLFTMMSGYPPVIRTEYLLALLYEKDIKKAEKIILKFDKIKKNYPYEKVIESELELIEYAKNNVNVGLM